MALDKRDKTKEVLRAPDKRDKNVKILMAPDKTHTTKRGSLDSRKER